MLVLSTEVQTDGSAASWISSFFSRKYENVLFCKISKPHDVINKHDVLPYSTKTWFQIHRQSKFADIAYKYKYFIQSEVEEPSMYRTLFSIRK